MPHAPRRGGPAPAATRSRPRACPVGRRRRSRAAPPPRPRPPPGVATGPAARIGQGFKPAPGRGAHLRRPSTASNAAGRRPRTPHRDVGTIGLESFAPPQLRHSGQGERGLGAPLVGIPWPGALAIAVRGGGGGAPCSPPNTSCLHLPSASRPRMRRSNASRRLADRRPPRDAPPLMARGGPFALDAHLPPALNQGDPIWSGFLLPHIVSCLSPKPSSFPILRRTRQATATRGAETR